MPENQENQNFSTQDTSNDLSSTQDSEILSTGDPNSDITKEDLYYMVNTLLDQMSMDRDASNERFEALEEELHTLTNSVSENSAQSALVVLQEEENNTVSSNTVEKISRTVSDLYDLTLSANTISENEIMSKPLDKYTTSESLSLVLCSLVLVILLYMVFFERR